LKNKLLLICWMNGSEGKGSMETLQKVHARNLVAWSKHKPKVVVFSADLTSNTEVDLFRDTYPERFFSVGMTEQNMMSMAGGMAREGYFPFVHTFAVFIYRRAYDQIAMSIAYPNVPVRMFGFLPGITTPGGATHQAIEDVAIMSTLPNMTVLEAGDATEVEQVLALAHDVPGPVYVRQLRGLVPRLFDPSKPMAIDQARVLSKGHDIALFSSGICTEEAMRATKVLQQRGVSLQHLHISTHKPFSDPLVLDAIASAKVGLITMENHTTLGGLGTNIAEMMAQHGIGKPLTKIGIHDTFAHGASRQYLMQEYGLDAIALVRHVERILAINLKISEEDLTDARLEAIHSAAKPEAL
jgi:transketolase